MSLIKEVIKYCKSAFLIFEEVQYHANLISYAFKIIVLNAIQNHDLLFLHTYTVQKNYTRETKALIRFTLHQKAENQSLLN